MNAPPASDVPAEGRIRGYVVERRYGDFRMTDGREVRFDVEYGWDYARGTGVRKTFDPAGKLLSSEDLVNGEMALSEIEQERVRALVRGQPALKSIANGPGVVVWGEGFLWRVTGDRYCDRGSRCIHAIIAKDGGLTAVGHAIVDLQSDRVVYPFYDGSKLKSSTGE
ncbi:MAG: hypothetical protein ABIR62_16690 [Dokdonella sp.]|uniref:hypothetical protein n=1 Tax=Dokdonella sp. TaxID=2291710 RepID=UPI003263C4FA